MSFVLLVFSHVGAVELGVLVGAMLVRPRRQPARLWSAPRPMSSHHNPRRLHAAFELAHDLPIPVSVGDRDGEIGILLQAGERG